MHLCYIDESGDDVAFDPAQTDQVPIFALAGLCVPLRSQKALVWEFLQLKKEFYPELVHRRLSDLIQFEYKGSILRKELRSTSRKKRRRAKGFIDKSLALLEKHGAQLIGQVHIKQAGEDNGPRRLYPNAVAAIAADFESLLAASRSEGLMILDSRTKAKNAGNVHAITTRRYRTGGGEYPHLAEGPVFGHSDTHVLLQLADLVVSALLLPMACWIYCRSYDFNVHVDECYSDLRQLFGQRLQQLEYRYVDDEGQRRGGLRVFDRIGSRPTHLIFREDPKLEPLEVGHARRALLPEPASDDQPPLELGDPDPR